MPQRAIPEDLKESLRQHYQRHREYHELTRVVVAWRHYFSKFYPDVCKFDPFPKLSFPGRDGKPLAPDFSAVFEQDQYAVLFEIVASEHSLRLEDDFRQLEAYDAPDLRFLDSDGQPSFEVARKDVAFLIPQRAEVPTINYYQERRETEGYERFSEDNLIIMHYAVRELQGEDVMDFVRIPSEANGNFHNGFLPCARRMSAIAAGHRFEFRTEEYLAQMDSLPFCNDEPPDSVLLDRLWMVVLPELYLQSARRAHPLGGRPATLSVDIHEVKQHVKQSYLGCDVRAKSLRRVLNTVAESSASVEATSDPNKFIVRYTTALRCGGYARGEVATAMGASEESGHLPALIYYFASHDLRAQRGQGPGQSQQLPLGFPEPEKSSEAP